jgi:hypothetical protein
MELERMSHRLQASIEAWLPDDAAQRAVVFGRYAEAWSALLSSIERIGREAGGPARVAMNGAEAEAEVEPKRKRRKRRGRKT